MESIDGLYPYTLKDIAGKILISGTYVVKQNIANLNINLPNGLYLVTISENGNEIQTKKLIIARQEKNSV